MTGKKEVHEYKSDDKTYRFMDRNRPSGKHPNNSKRQKFLNKFFKKRSTINKRKNKHGRNTHSD